MFLFEKLVNNRFVFHLKRRGFCIISSKVLGLGLLELWHLIYPRLSTGFVWLLVFLTSLSLMKFQVRYLALLLLFPVVDGFEWFWMESVPKNSQLMLVFFKAPFLYISCYTLMIFLIIILIMLSVLIVILYTPSVSRHLICVNK